MRRWLDRCAALCAIAPRVFALLGLAWGCAGFSAAERLRADEVDFAGVVAPIFAAHCSECHGPGKQESSFRLDIRDVVFSGGDMGEAAIVPPAQP